MQNFQDSAASTARQDASRTAAPLSEEIFCQNNSIIFNSHGFPDRSDSTFPDGQCQESRHYVDNYGTGGLLLGNCSAAVF
jgi:hypothetical protein